MSHGNNEGLNRTSSEPPAPSRESRNTMEDARTHPVDERHEGMGEKDCDDVSDNRLQAVQSGYDHPQSRARELVFLFVLCSTQFLTQSGLAQCIVTQRIIGESFGLGNQPSKLSWLSASYSLTVGTFILIAGRLGDVFGHKRFIVGGFIWFGLWSALSGFAVYSGFIFLAFCRAMQGIGPAFLLPNAIATIARCYEPGPKQNLIFGLFGATAPGGFLVGAVFSSILAEFAWWPWSQWVMCFTCLLLALMGFFALPATRRSKNPDEDTSSVWQRVDIVGSIIGVAGLVLFNFAWNQAPVVGWAKPYTYALLICGIALFIVFVIVEKRVRHPLIPFGVLKIDALFTLACIVAGWSSFGIFAYFGLSFLEVLRGLSPLHTSAQFVPVAISGLCAAITTGLSLARLRASTVMLMAMSAFTIGGILFPTLPVQQTYWAQTFVGTIVLPWGMDMSFPAATIILSRAMPRKHQGLAASLVTTFVNYSISIGLGIAGTVELHTSDGGKNILDGYRGAFYLGVGLAGAGVIVALVFCFVERQRSSASAIEQEADQA